MRRAKKIKVVPDPPETRRQMDSPGLSSIDRTSFMEDLQQDFGNPLHSTALEEALNVRVEGQVDKRTLKTAGKGHTVERTGTEEEDVDKRRRESRRAKDKTRRSGRTPAEDAADGEDGSEQNIQPAPTTDRGLGGDELHSRRKRRSRGQGSAASGQLEDKKTETELRDRVSAGMGEETDVGAVHKRRRRVLSSEETDKDTSWNQSPKKGKVLSGQAGQPRKSLRTGSRSKKSSSDKRAEDGATSGQTSGRDRWRRKGPAGPGGSHFEVVLDAFRHFCDQYSESVESAAVRESISCFSRHMEEQLLEKISSLKELQTLKRHNMKVMSSIRTKTQRLMCAKAELTRAERQVCLLQKEQAQVQQRLADIRRGQSFLRGLRGLSRQYLDHRLRHGANTETYGASSLPALLLETKLLQSREETTNTQSALKQRPRWKLSTAPQDQPEMSNTAVF